jgi:hypothetical protein
MPHALNIGAAATFLQEVFMENKAIFSIAAGGTDVTARGVNLTFVSPMPQSRRTNVTFKNATRTYRCAWFSRFRHLVGDMEQWEPNVGIEPRESQKRFTASMQATAPGLQRTRLFCGLPADTTAVAP